MFDLSKEKNRIRRCDVLRCDVVSISNFSGQALYLYSSLDSFGFLGNISFANFRLKQMFGISKEKTRIQRCDVLRCYVVSISKLSLQALFLVSSLDSFGFLGSIVFANFRSKQMFDISKEKTRIWRCDILRCDVVCISKFSLQALFLVSSLDSFGFLGYISFANFRSKQMFDVSKEKTRIWRCDILRCDDSVHFEKFTPFLRFWHGPCRGW